MDEIKSMQYLNIEKVNQNKIDSIVNKGIPKIKKKDKKGIKKIAPFDNIK